MSAPVCAPSEGSLLSGLSQGHANVRDNPIDKALADNYILDNVMRAGYATSISMTSKKYNIEKIGGR